jgi:hypothetical protein
MSRPALTSTFLLLLSSFSSKQLWAQGTFLSTGGGVPLVTRTFPLQTGGSLSPVIGFEVGFATREVASPGELHDSFSVFVSDNSGQRLSFLLTADTSGFVWAPVSPGTIPVSESSITRTATPFPTTEQTFPSARSYLVSWPVPPQFTAGSFNLTLDLFDNQNGVGSLAYFTPPTVVPEPSHLTLLGIAGMLFALKTRRAA